MALKQMNLSMLTIIACKGALQLSLNYHECATQL